LNGKLTILLNLFVNKERASISYLLREESGFILLYLLNVNNMLDKENNIFVRLFSLKDLICRFIAILMTDNQLFRLRVKERS